MSTPDTVQTPQDQQVPTAPTTDQATAPAADQTAAAALDTNDPDLIELAEAKAAAQAEEAAKNADAGTDQEGTQPQPTAPQGSQAQPPGQPQQPPMIPKPRFEEMVARALRAEQTIAHQAGQIEALKSVATPPKADAAQQNAPMLTTPQAKLAAIQETMDDLAARFDAGEITYADMKKQERALTDQELQIREEVLLSKVAPQSNEDGNALYLETLTAQIEQKHPWILTFDKVGTDSDWKFLESKARENLADRGVSLKGAVGSYELRAEMGRLADQYGPAMVGPVAQAKGVPVPVLRQQQQQRRPAGPSQAAQARAAKLDTRAGIPPNLDDMRGVGEDTGIPSASRIEQMNEEEIAALPKAVRNRILGIQA